MKKRVFFYLHLITSNNCLPNNIIVKICEFYTETPLVFGLSNNRSFICYLLIHLQTKFKTLDYTIMFLSIQLLDFNKENASESFLNEQVPTEKDKQTYNNLYTEHEEDLEDEFEEDEMFSFIQFNFSDIQNMSDVSIDKQTFDKAISDCGLFNSYDCFGLNKTNNKSFELLLNMFAGVSPNNIDFVDVNLLNCDFEEIKEKIQLRKDQSLPIVFNYLFYVIE
jgi:hypothetical protein